MLRQSGWKLKVRVWVERDGQRILGPGRAELLGHIDKLHSISAAAKHMNMSYRRAWNMVRSTNDAAGQDLVEVSTGGQGGGGARLTAHGKEACRFYQDLINQLTNTAAKASGLKVGV